MIGRREVLGAIRYPAGLFAAGVALPVLRAANAAEMLAELSRERAEPEVLASDEAYWGQIAQMFTMDRGVINLNNGGVSPSPRVVQEAMARHLARANSWPPPEALWREQEPERETARARLARQWGVDPEEIALTRNASESLQICQFGLDLKPGDEVLTTTLDYPRMITTFKQRERRDGIVLRQIKIPVPCEDDAEVVRRFEAAITPRTRLILMSHVVFLNGQILPVRAVVAMARTRNGGVPVVVDGAHAFAQFDFSIGDLGCDYYGTSLHKWLAAPHGTGMLFVRRDRIAALWSLMGSDEKNSADIRKFEEIGTHPVANTLAVAEALTFHQAIGPARKEARLRFLRDRWANRLLAAGGGRVHLATSVKKPFSCAIGTVRIDGLDTAKLQEHLWSKQRILTVGIKHEEVEGLRITPSVYTTVEEIDRFCEAVESVMKNGLPA